MTKILLVDDREDNLISIGSILEPGGYQFVKANSGRQAPAIKVIKKNKPATPVLLEAEIAEAEKKLNEISAMMSLPEVARDATELIKLDEEYRQTEARLTVLYSQWEAAAAKG